MKRDEYLIVTGGELQEETERERERAMLDKEDQSTFIMVTHSVTIQQYRATSLCIKKHESPTTNHYLNYLLIYTLFSQINHNPKDQRDQTCFFCPMNCPKPTHPLLTVEEDKEKQQICPTEKLELENAGIEFFFVKVKVHLYGLRTFSNLLA